MASGESREGSESSIVAPPIASAGDEGASMPGLVVTLNQAARHPASWLFALAWLLAVLCLIVTGYGALALQDTPFGVFALALALGSIALTTGAPPAQRPAASSANKPWAQALLIALVIALSLSETPLLDLLLRAAPQILQRISLNDFYELAYSVANPIVYFALPTLLLGALGVRPRDFNLGVGWRSWRVVLLWAAPLLIMLIGALIFTSSRRFLPLIPIVVVGNALQNGFFEEFLWRGVVMSRLRLALGASWSIALSSLLFGLWHTLAESGAVRGNVLAAMALSIVSLAPIGLAFAIVVYRTRNLLASSFIHVLWDTTMQLL